MNLTPLPIREYMVEPFRLGTSISAALVWPSPSLTKDFVAAAKGLAASPSSRLSARGHTHRVPIEGSLHISLHGDLSVRGMFHA
jgi:hypothetical protein